MSRYASGEMDRRIGDIIKIGTVKAVNAADYTVQVDLDGPDTDWIQVGAMRAGPDRAYWLPEVGEQVMIAAPSGELADAVVICSLYQDAYPEPADNPDIARVVFKDGAIVEYDRAAHAYKIDLSASSGSVTVICSQATVQADTVTLDAPETECTGNLTVAGNFSMGSGGSTATISGSVSINGPSLTHNGKNVGSDHTHGGIQPGGSNTDGPN